MPELKAEKSEMSCVEFTQAALRQHIAPPSIGSVKTRIRHASRRLGWSHSRTKDAWYADPRISISADEIRAVEEQTGLRYARQEMRTNDELIASMSALLAGNEADFYSAFVTALRSLARPNHRT